MLVSLRAGLDLSWVLGMLGSGLCCWRECGQCTFHPGPGQATQGGGETLLARQARANLQHLRLVSGVGGNCLYLPVTSRPALLACMQHNRKFLPG